MQLLSQIECSYILTAICIFNWVISALMILPRCSDKPADFTNLYESLLAVIAVAYRRLETIFPLLRIVAGKRCAAAGFILSWGTHSCCYCIFKERLLICF